MCSVNEEFLYDTVAKMAYFGPILFNVAINL